MSNHNKRFTRRDLGRTALAGAGALGAVSASGAGAIPRRQLGKTGLEVSIFGLGSAPLGNDAVSQQETSRIVDRLIDHGVNYIDTAPIYKMAERKLGVALKGKRDKFVLVTKVEATSRRDANWYVKESLLKLGTDYLDLVYIHNIGLTDRFPDLGAVTAKDSVLDGLLRLKEQGVVRHIGITTHLRGKRALPVLETGEMEVIMCAANFVDVHTYNFEGTLFEEARKRGMGIVAMKILGGPKGAGARLSDPEHYDDAVRYALSIPGLSTAVMGVTSVAELDQAVAAVKNYKPFTPEELTRVTAKGKAMAAEWGELRGPVEWA